MKNDILSGALTWDGARSQLRKILEDYVKDPPPPRRSRDEDRPPPNESLLSWWVRRDFDLYFGALAFSMALLVLSCFSMAARVGGIGESSLRPSASQHVYRAQVAAAVLLVGGSCASLWMVRRPKVPGSERQ